jgi:hypothetical protein
MLPRCDAFSQFTDRIPLQQTNCALNSHPGMIYDAHSHSTVDKSLSWKHRQGHSNFYYAIGVALEVTRLDHCRTGEAFAPH